MLGGRTWDEWVAEYSRSHRHPVNRVCHTIGIPLIASSLPTFVAMLFLPNIWPLPVGMFAIGWLLQFIGHWYEGKPPEFFRDWRFLFVGLRWWAAKIKGNA